METSRNLLDYVYVLLKWRRLIVVSVLVCTVATAAVSLILPERWTASTRLLPPEEESDSFNLSMLASAAVPANLGRLVGGGVTPAERLMTILGSRRVLGAVVDRFSLVAALGATSREHAIDLLDAQVERELGRDGSLLVSATATTPAQAAAVCNALAEELDTVNRAGKRYQAAALRRFLEERRGAVQQEMLADAGRFREYQEQHGLVDLEAQTRAAVAVVQGAVQELTLQEVKLQVAREQLAPGQPELRQLESEVAALRQQLAALTGVARAEMGSQAAAALASLGPGLRDLPAVGQEYARLALEQKIKEQILAYLGTRLEEAKYSEARNTPTIQVLDPATPPETRSWPRRTLMVLVAAAVSLMSSVVLAFALESAGQLAREQRDQLDRIAALFPGRRR